MKLSCCSMLLLLLACMSAPAQQGFNCLDNCGQYTGSCTACHIVQGPEVWIAEQFSACGSCSNQSIRTMPKVPFQARPVDSVLAWLENVTVRRDPKMLRLMAMTPEKHVEAMRRAVRLKLDGAMLGACPRSFRVGTLVLLPAEIEATRQRLIYVAAN